MGREEYRLEDDEDLDAARDAAVDVLRSDDNRVSSDHMAVTRGLLYIGDVLRKGFDLLAGKQEK